MIRKATQNDINTIAQFNVNMAKETENLDLDLDTLKKGVEAIITEPSKGTYYVYEKDNKIVGQIMYTYEWSDWRNRYFWWIQSVYVEKNYRKQGIFKSLYSHLKELVLNDDSVCGLRLYVEKENKSAQATYKNLGMDETHYLLYEWEK